MTDETGTYDIAASAPMLIKRCGKLISQTVNKTLADAGYAVTGSQWAILTLLRHEDGVTQQELADRNSASKVTAFRLIERLEELGFVRREPDARDGRCKRVFLTPEGEGLLRELTPLVKENAARLTRDIGEAEFAAMMDALRKIEENALRFLE